jgi:hypothetical protein
LKRTLFIAAAVWLLQVPTANAQSSSTVIGLRLAHLRYVADPTGELGWLSGNERHCRQFGLGMTSDFGPAFQPYFVLKADSMSATGRQFDAMASMRARTKSGDADLPLFSMPPLPWCKA